MDNFKQRYWYALNEWLNPSGFGCWQLAGEYFENGVPKGWGNIEEKNALNLINTALDQGINFFDTASSYGNGKSEALLGKAISKSQNKHQAFVCTKLPLLQHELETLTLDQNFIQRVDASLERLQRDRIDVLLLHNPPDLIEWDKFDTSMLEKLKQAGKIGCYGVSCRSINGVQKLVEANFGSCIEWVFNLFERRPIHLFPAFADQKINFIARSPLSRGIFSPKYKNDFPQYQGNDFRSTLPEDWIQWILGSIHALDLTNQQREKLPQIALQYCLSYEEVSAVIPGINKQAYLDDYLNLAKSNYLTDEFLQKLHEHTEACFPKWK
ncbi:MAG: aldo/keto reductase [Flammeovirgaceae bacterium]